VPPPLAPGTCAGARLHVLYARRREHADGAAVARVAGGTAQAVLQALLAAALVDGGRVDLSL
jgi:hypothetical protein